jgi:hypothetical protein
MTYGSRFARRLDIDALIEDLTRVLTSAIEKS